MILENVKLSKEEYEFLQTIKEDYNWIARDSNGNLCAYEYRPYKKGDFWNRSCAFCTLNSCNHMFSFIQWTDNVPTLISDIIEKCQMSENKLGTNTMTDFEAIKVSRGERIVLQMLEKQYQWIARNRNGNLYIHENKPKKSLTVWDSGDYFELNGLYAFNHHFQFVQWEDEEPWLIKDILNKCGVKFE